MSVGLSPKYTLDLPLEDLTSEQFLIIALDVINKLGWELSDFTRSCIKAYAQFSVNSWNQVTIDIEDNLVKVQSKCTAAQLIDWGGNKQNVDDFISKFHEIKVNFTSEELAAEYDSLKGKFDADEIEETGNGKKNEVKIKGFAALFIPVKGFSVTPVLIDINIAVFILMAILGVGIMVPDNEALVRWGANYTPLTLDGQWWRLLSNIFLHAGLFHLLMNMYALLYIGILLEPHLGAIRFASAYILTGIAASVTSLWWHDLTVSVGASGAIFGMYGVFLAMLSTNYIEKSARKAFLTSIAIFVGYNLLNGIKGNIDNAAHIGGLLSGILIGYIYMISLRNPSSANTKSLTIAVASIIIIGGSAIAYSSIPNYISIYEEKIKSFISMESMALEVYSLREDDSKEEKIARIQRGLYYWNENIKLLKDLNKLKLPKQFYQRDDKLIEYCNLRIKLYNLMYKAVDENTDRYNALLKSYSIDVQAMVDELKNPAQ